MLSAMLASWPILGLRIYLAHPRLWLRPCIGLLLAWIMMLSAIIGVGWWWWPTPSPHWSRWLAHLGIDLGLAAAAALAVWIFLLPLVMSFALERLAREAQRLAGAPPPQDEPLFASVRSSLHVLVRTLPLRIGWMGLALLSAFSGPIGVIVVACAMAHMAAIDAFDIALSARGIGGRRRMEIQRMHRHEVTQGALAAAALNIGLGLTALGWLLWLPALVAGAATRVVSWPEVSGPGPGGR